MQTLRKKTSPCKYKNEPSRFLGEGVSFKAKLIGILEVSEARGDRMCQEALADLKMAIRAAGEHKQRITINIAIDGLRLRDEKTGDSLYHHPVHKISFIAQDMSDSRAFGYIFGSPDTGHRFFGIKTDKAASQVVIAMRDLFQVVFELKKKEIELAKQHIEQKSRFGSSNNSASLFSDTNTATISTATITAAAAASSNNTTTSKSYQNGDSHTTSSSKLISVSETTYTSKAPGGGGEGASARPVVAESAIADLVDLELELSSIQQGIHQMERITPSDPFGPNNSSSDPFGDSFTSYPQKPFLPPPPSARDRPSRNASAASDSSSIIFSPKTPRTGAGSVDTSSQEASLFRTSQDEPTSGWFTPTGGNDSLFEDAVSGGGGSGEGAGEPPPPPPKESNASILSQFDVFTELDPLGTGRKTVPADSTLFCANFDSFPQPNSNSSGAAAATATLFQTDPFAEGDPFQDEFAKAPDPFDTDFVFNKPPDIILASGRPPADKLQPLFPAASNRSPIQRTTITTTTTTKLHENLSLDISSESESAPEPPPRPATNLTPIKPPPLPPKKQPGDLAMKPPPRPPHIEDAHYDYMDNYETGFASTLNNKDQQTPPLPVPARKSRFDADFSTVIPQRPKKFQHNNNNSSSAVQQQEDDYLQPIIAPPKRNPSAAATMNMNSAGPILLPPPSMKKDSSKRTHLNQSSQKNSQSVASYLESKPKFMSTIAASTTDKLNLTPDTLDITLSQLTLSGLNELANKLNIPASQLSNMTLVQLTSYLSNYMKDGSNTNNTVDSASPTSAITSDATFPTFKADFAANVNDMNTNTTKAEPYDRYAVFRELLQQDTTTIDNNNETPIEVEEEDIQQQDEEIKEDENDPSTICKIEKIVKVSKATTPDQLKQIQIESKEKHKPTFENNSNKTDRYAALRDIIIEDVVIPSTEVKENNVENESNEDVEQLKDEQVKVMSEEEQNDLNQDLKQKRLSKEDVNNDEIVESNNIEYDLSKSEKIKSPVPVPVSEIIQTPNHHITTSGSVSDAMSGSSPEVDNVQNTTDTVTKNKKNVENTVRESWAIFDTPRRDAKEKQAQSEEGVSPWSSDSKEFGNGSPSEWHQQRRDSGDWNRRRRNRDGTWWENQTDIKGHYEKAAPSRVPSSYSRERRSTDSYDDEWYEPDRPRRRIRQQASAHMWSSTSGGCGGGTGGQSSSSRDVSPWEEEEQRQSPPPPPLPPSRGRRDREECWPPCSRRGRGPSYDRDRMRRREDSWDEDDDYEYDKDEYVGKFHWPERHNSRDSDRASRDSDRHSASREAQDHWDDGGERGGEQWPPEERRHVRRRGGGHPPQDDRWCRPDWDHENEMVCGGGGGGKEKIRFGQRWPPMRDRKQRESDHRYYKRDHSQESPWEDDYSNDPDEPHSPRYLSTSTRRSWKRPSSASEMDRKSGEIKSRAPYYVNAGGSDGERDRKYRSSRRSRSRDSQCAELPQHQRHKPDASLTLGRYSHRNKMYGQKFENDFSSLPPQEKAATLGRKAKDKELPSPKIENEQSSIISKTRNKQQQHLMFENDFVNSETDSPIIGVSKTKFNFENDFETSEAESPTINRHCKSTRGYHAQSPPTESSHNRGLKVVTKKQSIAFESNVSFKSRKGEPKSAAAPQVVAKQQKSLFEDDFSPTEKVGTAGLVCVGGEDSNGITVIAEEGGQGSEPPARVSFTENNLDKMPQEVRRQNKHILAKRMSNNIRGDDGHIIIKKSESVNIFARENDPFDDDFFSGRDCDEVDVTNVDNLKGSSPNSAVVEFKWTEDFDSFEIPEEK